MGTDLVAAAGVTQIRWGSSSEMTPTTAQHEAQTETFGAVQHEAALLETGEVVT